MMPQIDVLKRHIASTFDTIWHKVDTMIAMLKRLHRVRAFMRRDAGCALFPPRILHNFHLPDGFHVMATIRRIDHGATPAPPARDFGDGRLDEFALSVNSARQFIPQQVLH